MLTKRIWLRALRAVGFLAAVVLGALVVAAAGFAAFALGMSADAESLVIVAVIALLATGMLVGLAAAVGGYKRTALGATALVAIACGAAVLSPESEFDAAAFRQARAERDYDELYTQAQRAVAQDVLVGRTKHEVSSLLGGPGSATRREWSWYVGVHNDFFGPGDDTWFLVRFDLRTGRVIGTSV